MHVFPPGGVHGTSFGYLVSDLDPGDALTSFAHDAREVASEGDRERQLLDLPFLYSTQHTEHPASVPT